jgi:carboxyl-terminal processing protease
MAYSLKKAGISLVGTTTRGAVLGGSAFILQNESLLLIPVVDVKIDGNRLEGVGVSPTIEVNAILEYSQGNDPQLDAAVDIAVKENVK